MAEPVIVPVRLEVTDVDTSGINFVNAEKEISKSLSSLKKSVQDVFSGIDPSAINKPIEKSMASVEKSLQRAADAELRLNEAMVHAGKSTSAYKAKIKGLDEEIASYATSVAELESLMESQKKLDNGNNPMLSKAYANSLQAGLDEAKAKLQSLLRERDKINPIDFIDDASPIELAKVSNTLKKCVAEYGEAVKKSEEFNKTAKDNAMTAEYNELMAKAEQYRKKLETLSDQSIEMADLGATDKAWEKLRYHTENTYTDLKSITNQLREMVKTGAAFRFGDGDTKSLLKQLKGFSVSNSNRVRAVRTRANEHESPYTDDYKQALKELYAYEKQVNALREKSNNLMASGADKEKFVGIVEQAERLDIKIDEIKNGLMAMVNSGKAFKVGQGNAEAELQRLRDKSGSLQSSLTGVADGARLAQGGLAALGVTHPKLAAILGTVGKIASGFVRVAKVAGQVGATIVRGFAQAVKVLGKITSAVRNLASKFISLGKGILNSIRNMNIFGKSGRKTTTDMGSRFKKLTKNILMWGFGFRTAYYAIRRLRTVFMDGFKAMGDQFEEIGAPMKEMLEAFNRLKGSLATAFQPLVSVVMPILTRFMNYLSGMLEAFATFTATLTGQGHIYKAVAKNIDSVSKSAKNANKQLGSYDKLEVIQQDNSEYEYEKQEIGESESAASSFADMVKAAWENVDFVGVGAFVTGQLLTVLNNIEKAVIPRVTVFANRLVTSLYSFLEGVDATAIGDAVGGIVDALVNGLDWEQIGLLGANIFNTVWGFLDGLVNGINWETLGESIATGVSSLFTNLNFDSWVGYISGLTNGIATAVTTAVSNVDWTTLATDLSNAVGKLFESIDPVTIGTAINTVLTSAFDFLIGFFSTDAPTKVTTFFTTLIATIDWAGIADSLILAVKTMLTSVGGALASSDNPLLSSFGSIFLTLKEVITALEPAISSIITSTWPIIDSILPIITELLPPIAEIISKAVVMVMPVLVSLFESLMPIIGDLVAMLLPLILDLLTSLQPIFNAFIITILPFLVRTLETVMPLINSILGLVTDLLAPLTSLLGPLLEIVFNMMEPALDILKPIITVITSLVNLISAVLRPVLDVLTPILSAINSLFEALSPAMSLVMIPVEILAEKFSFVASILTSILEPAIKVVMKIIEALANVVGTIGTAFTGAFSAARSAIDKLAQKIKEPLNAVLGFVEKLANGFISAVNGLIRAINKLSFDVPDWVPGIGGKKLGFNLTEISSVSIPRLAQGAVIPPNKEFLAVLGDQKNGTNIEAPLDTIKQAVAEVLAEIGGVGNKQPIVLQVNGRTLAQVVWDEQEKRYKQTGRAMA